jgi:antitoxin component HigA of HigAB toxin-antitoxin module
MRERGRWPRQAPSLPDLLYYLMEQHGLSRADLVPLLGTPSRVSEVLRGKRDWSFEQVSSPRRQVLSRSAEFLRDSVVTRHALGSIIYRNPAGKAI